MSARHPTLSEAQQQQEIGLRLMREHTIRKVHARGFVYYCRGYKRSGSGQQRLGFYEWPHSDISKRCESCGCVLRKKGDGRMIPLDPKQEDWRWGNFEGAWGTVCLPCWNRLAPPHAHIQEIYATKVRINRCKKEISKCQKQLSTQLETSEHF